MNKKKILAIILIFIGVILLIAPTISNQILKYKAKESTELIDKIEADKMQKNNEAKAIYDYDSVSEVGVYETMTNLSKVDKSKIIGQIISPEIKMNVAIFKGITNANLLVGAGTMKSDQKMGEGNYALAAHYIAKDGVLFNRLLDVNKGVKFFLTDKKNIYEYVAEKRVVLPDDSFYMIKNEEEKKYGTPILTMMTCPKESRSNKRVFVVCKLVDTYSYKENIKKIKK